MRRPHSRCPLPPGGPRGNRRGPSARRRLAGGIALAPLLGLGACRAAPPAALEALRARGTPTLEAIFLEPSIQGTPPAAEGLSADGRWLVLRWGPWAPPEVQPNGEVGDPPEPALRLLDVEDPAASAHRGRPLAEVLEGATTDEDPPEERWAWSPAGARLAWARGREVRLLEANEGRVVVLASEPAAVEEAAPDEGQAPSDTAEEEAQEDAPVRRLAFSEDGGELRVFAGDHLHRIPLGATSEPRPLAEHPRHAPELDAAAHRLQWSRDLGVAFGADPTPREPEASEGEQDGEVADTRDGAEEDATEPSTEEAEPAAQVWHVAEARGVVLEGYAEARWMERPRLAPDGRFVFAIDNDREGEPEPTLVPDYLSERVTAPEGRRLLADDGPSPFRLWIWDTSDGTRRELLAAESPPPVDDDAPGDDEENAVAGTTEEVPSEDGADEAPPARREGDWWIRSLGWAPGPLDRPARFAFERTSADYRRLEVWCWSEGGAALLWSESDAAWVGGYGRRARWNATGTHLLVGSEGTPLSSTPGRAQLFAIDVAGGTTRQLTELAGELTGFTPTPDGGVFFEGSDEDLARRVLGRLSEAQLAGRAPAGPGHPRARLATPAGWNDAPRAAGGTQERERVVFAHATLGRPEELWVTDAAGARPLTRTVPEPFEAVPWILPDRLIVEIEPDEGAPEEGRRVHAHVYLPRDGSASGKLADWRSSPRATIVFIHGAGYLQNVTDSMTRYPLNLMFHSRLASMGYPVVDVDYRGSAGYGREFRTDVQYHLGGEDLEDLHRVLDELARRGVVDAERVGVYGGSYGGFLTMMALFTAPARWAVGAALRSVTDWRTYHPTYTQPRLGRPSTHPEAYARSSPIDHVDGLEDPLLVLHGMRDANVFAQDSIRLIEALIDRGKDFDAMLYPSQRHAFEDGPHWLDEYRRIERFLLEHLGPPTR